MLKRILAILLVSATLLAAIPSATASAKSFTDVSANAYYAEAVNWACENGVTAGTGNGSTFSPNKTCTRAQIITMIWNSFGRPQPTEKYSVLPDGPQTSAGYDESGNIIAVEAEDVTGTIEINDIRESDYYCTAVEWAHEIGAFLGNTFEPNKPCTRAQAVWYLWVAYGRTTVLGNGQLHKTGFSDITAETCENFRTSKAGSSSDYALGYMSQLIINGIDYNNYYFAMAVLWAKTKGIVAGTGDGTTFSPNATCTRAQIVTMLYNNASSAEKCADGNHNFCARNADEQYLMSAATCSSNARYYTACITCGLSSKDSTGDTWYDSQHIYNAEIPHTYELCVEPTTDRYGLKYCTDCGYQTQVAKISDHVHKWVYTKSRTGAYYAYDRFQGSRTTMLEYVVYADMSLSLSRETHYNVMKQGLESMDEAGKYYYKNGKPVGLITDEYISKLCLSGSDCSTMYYYCSVCGELQIPATLDELYGENAIFGTNDTVYRGKNIKPSITRAD